MIRMYKVGALALVFIGIVAGHTAAQGAPFAQVVMDEATPPSNDDFDAATVVSALPFDDTIDTRAATGAPDDPPGRMARFPKMPPSSGSRPSWKTGC